MDDMFWGFDMDALGEPDVPAAGAKPEAVPEPVLEAEPETEEINDFFTDMDALGEPDVPAAGAKPEAVPEPVLEAEPETEEINDFFTDMDALGEPDVSAAGAKPEAVPEPVLEAEPETDDFLMQDAEISFTSETKNASFLSPELQEKTMAPVQDEEEDFLFMPESAASDNDQDLLNAAVTEQALYFYDPDEIEGAVTSEMFYCTLHQNMLFVQKSEEWLKACNSAYPTHPIQAVTALMADHEKVFCAPKVVTFSKSWNIPELLEQESIRREAERVSEYLWKNTLQQAEGTEQPQWIATIWTAKMMQHLVNHAMITMR